MSFLQLQQGHSHTLIKCQVCNTIMAQCRCPHPNKMVTFDVCMTCFQKSLDEEVKAAQWPIRKTVYVHADRDSMYTVGEQLGLEGQALKQFSYTCYEVEVELEVQKDGAAWIVAVDGRQLK